MIVLIPDINLLNLFLDNKMSILRNMEPLNEVQDFSLLLVKMDESQESVHVSMHLSVFRVIHNKKKFHMFVVNIVLISSREVKKSIFYWWFWQSWNIHFHLAWWNNLGVTQRWNNVDSSLRWIKLNRRCCYVVCPLGSRTSPKDL